MNASRHVVRMGPVCLAGFIACAGGLGGCASDDTLAAEPNRQAGSGAETPPKSKQLSATVTGVSVRDMLCGNAGFVLVDVTLDKGWADDVNFDMRVFVGDYLGEFAYGSEIEAHRSMCVVCVPDEPEFVSLPKVGEVAYLRPADLAPTPAGQVPVIDHATDMRAEVLWDKEIQLHASKSLIDARAVEIDEELSRLSTNRELPEGHWAREWAGRYWLSNVSLRVSPEAGVSYTWYGCFGFEDGNHGRVIGTFDEDRDGTADGLEVEWKLARKSGAGFDSKRLYFVRWDDADGRTSRRYLVPEWRVAELIEEVNRGWELPPIAPLREDDAEIWRGEVRGVLKVPGRWAELLKREPAPLR